ncbi:hypothetical protein J7M02_01715 [Candidatus Aerophobetes bacterium]|nr:hypothetical protein [Candidatus Aerophobetes bacterium]
MKYRYNLYQDEVWLVILSGHYGLDESFYPLLGTVHYSGGWFLYPGTKESTIN